MEITIHNLCLLLAFISFVAAGFGVTARVNLVAIGLAFFMLTFLIRQ